MTLQELATQYEGYLTTDKRDNGETFIKGKDSLTLEQEKKLYSLCHDAHGDMLPDDYKYAFISEALEALSNHDDPDDIQLEPDIYNHDLLKWLASHLERMGYCDEAAYEYNCKKPDIITRIGYGQLYEKQEVLGLVLAWLENELEELENE